MFLSTLIVSYDEECESQSFISTQNFVLRLHLTRQMQKRVSLYVETCAKFCAAVYIITAICRLFFHLIMKERLFRFVCLYKTQARLTHVVICTNDLTTILSGPQNYFVSDKLLIFIILRYIVCIFRRCS